MSLFECRIHFSFGWMVFWICADPVAGNLRPTHNSHSARFYGTDNYLFSNLHFCDTTMRLYDEQNDRHVSDETSARMPCILFFISFGFSGVTICWIFGMEEIAESGHRLLWDVSESRSSYVPALPAYIDVVTGSVLEMRWVLLLG